MVDWLLPFLFALGNEECYGIMWEVKKEWVVEVYGK